MTIAEAIARPMIGAMFVYGGLDSLRHPEGKAPTAEHVTASLTDATGVPPARLVMVNGAVQVGAGVALAVGFLPRPAAIALAASLVPTTLAGHRFWEKKDPKERAGQTIQFLKNLSMFGGLVLAATSTGGRPSVPWRVKRVVHTAVDRAGERLGDLHPGA
jgi:putative oxidoreductase